MGKTEKQDNRITEKQDIKAAEQNDVKAPEKPDAKVTEKPDTGAAGKADAKNTEKSDVSAAGKPDAKAPEKPETRAAVKADAKASDKQGVRINVRALAAAGLVVLALVVAAALVVPKYGSVFAQYKEQHAAYKAAKADLSAAQKDNDRLKQELGELQELDAKVKTSEEEAFKLAAQLEQDIVDGKTDKKICYITIDDGPYNRGNKFLELFNKYDIKATFFLTTANGNKLPDQADISAESQYPEYLKYGHTIGNHTYSHDYSANGIYKNATTFMEAVKKQEEFTEKATGGYKTRIVRFPGGTATAGKQLDSIEASLREAGYTWINWTVDSGDSFGSDKVTPSAIKSTVLGAAKDEKIMVPLFHEWSQKSLEALPDIIESLQEQGYIFLPLFPESIMVER